MKNSIISIRTPMNKATHEPLFAIDLTDGTTMIRTHEQFIRDLHGSHLTLSIAEAAANPILNRIRLNDLVDGTVEHKFTFQKAGSEFIADADYVKSLVGRTSGNIRKVKLSDGTITEKVPAIGDRVIKSADGYVPNGFLKLETNASSNEHWYNSSQFAVGKIQAFGGKIDIPSESVSAVE